MRGKYSIHNKYYISNMVKQMTVQERSNIMTKSFQELWHTIWGGSPTEAIYRSEENSSRDKFDYLQKEGILSTIVKECSNCCWMEPEWGFPKGRRNYREKDYECALREFSEETGYPIEKIRNFQNIFPYEETFIGSNYKCYKHKYYLTVIDYEDSIHYVNNFQRGEVSKMEWKTLEECLESIRDYNFEKKRMIQTIDHCIRTYKAVELL